MWRLVLVCGLCLYPLQISNTQPQMEDLESIIKAMENIVSFYAKAHDSMNLDGIFGLRLLKDETSSALQTSELVHSLPSTVASRLFTLHDLCSEILFSSLTKLKELDPKYYEQFEPMLTKSLGVSGTLKSVNLTMQWMKDKRKLADEFSEDDSDQCLAQLLGTEEGFRQCSIESKCLQLISARGFTEYELTHQILYTIVAEQVGPDCVQHLDELLQQQGYSNGIESLQMEFCSNNFLEMSEALTELVNFVIVEQYQDLFLEQEVICPLLGFTEFLHRDWLTQILSWQHSSGCYGEFNGQNFTANSPSNRKLMKEKEFSDGCLSHKTAVAAGALGQYLKYLTSHSDIVKQHLYGENNLKRSFQEHAPVRRKIEQLHEWEDRVNLNDPNFDRDDTDDHGGDNDEDEKDNDNQYHNKQNDGNDENGDDDEEEEDGYDGQHEEEEDNEDIGNKGQPVLAAPKQDEEEEAEEEEEEQEEAVYNDNQYAESNQRKNDGQMGARQVQLEPLNWPQEAHDVNDDDAGDYNYYDQSLEKQKIVTTKAVLSKKQPMIQEKSYSNGSDEFTGSPLQGYAVVLLCMGVVLGVMYHFLKNRRLVIRYRIR